MTKQKTTHLARCHGHIVFEYNNNLTALTGASESYRRVVCYMCAARIRYTAAKIQKRRRQVCRVKIGNE